ncbi:MAG: CoA transferase [SAR202 cluster bacterium]|jgi:crotonobetainyl-CoA:carnitine CoA-transferase CaiB-like acyl-CoA transferase|nr:CoA transferase [SAR202 cluster bacterium]MDP6513113.1 CoA transferase [SAR202 cluster bacterium]MDP6715100.1 CoA transferase [SAR202 cluster bacterium]
MSDNSTRLPLSGIRVADFGWMIAGPLATRPLANFGAEVIRIESTARIDEIRALGPRPEGNTSPNVAGVFNDCNTSKLSMTINLGTPEGIDLAKQVVSVSDVVTNNFRGDRMGRWGLAYEDLVKLKPDIIMLGMAMMGTTGVHRDYGGNGLNIIAGAGISGITGLPDQPPVGTGSLYPDFSGNPNHATLAVLAALRHRNRTGRGQFIDLAQYESTISLLGASVLQYTTLGSVPVRPGNRSSWAAPHGVYRCAGDDRWCAIAVETEDEWEGLRRALGEPNWSAEDRFQTVDGRKKHEDDLDGLIEAWTRDLQDQEVMRRLQRHGVSAGVVQNSQDLVENDPGFRNRHIRVMDHPEVGDMTLHGETISISGVDPVVKLAPPMGEHTEYVLKEVLGLPETAVNELYVDGILH